MFKMRTYIFSGKGGAGKSTAAGAFALACAEHGKTLWADLDKNGAAIQRVLSPDGNIPHSNENVFPITYPNGLDCSGTSYTIDNLIGAATGIFNFEPIEPKRGRTKSEFDKYMDQFKGKYGMVAWNDMANIMFGFTTFPEMIAEIVELVDIVIACEEQDVEYLILDLEPTKGTKRLIQAALTSARSIENMKKEGESLFKRLIQKAATQPDIYRFLKSDFVKNGYDYANVLRNAMGNIVTGTYVLCCGPQISKVQEMEEDIIPFVKGRYTMYWSRQVHGTTSKQDSKVFQASIGGYVIDDVFKTPSGYIKKIHRKQIEHVKQMADKERLPVILIDHDDVLDYAKDTKRLEALRPIGRRMYRVIVGRR